MVKCKSVNQIEERRNKMYPSPLMKDETTKAKGKRAIKASSIENTESFRGKKVGKKYRAYPMGKLNKRGLEAIEKAHEKLSH